MQDQPEIEPGRETKSTGATFGLLGVAVLAVGAFIWTGFGEGIQQGRSNVVRTVIDKSMQRLGLGQAPNALIEGEWYLSVYYGPDFTDVTPVGLGHPLQGDIHVGPGFVWHLRERCRERLGKRL
ncbi:hypothetical protein NKH61_31360 [Mesorhizobium sp. M1005]|uniref:hypothetical protein n=1 Tax=unclassified Mesorhizobium TaxID=325217 RepID=UPI003338286B